MLDYIKIQTENQNEINRFRSHSDFKKCKPTNNNYQSFAQKDGYKIRLDFRKVSENNRFIGYRSVSISISPHYHKNNYLHNGNDFNVNDCIYAIQEIADYLGIKPRLYNAYKVVNLEYGVNITPQQDTSFLMDNLRYYKKTVFIAPNSNTPYFKITNATKYKEVKVYHKGIQFADEPHLNINSNMMRFEIRRKQSKGINKSLGIFTMLDLLNSEKYGRLAEELIKETEHLLILNPRAMETHEKPYQKKFLRQCKGVNFWRDLINGRNRNKFGNNKKRYFNLLQKKDNLKHQIKVQIIDKVYELLKCANSTQRTPIKWEESQNKKHPKRG